MSRKRKVKGVDTRLFLIKNTIKTCKYYFKNIFYILFMNFAFLAILFYFFKDAYGVFLLNITSNSLSTSPDTANTNAFLFKILYYSIFIILFSVIKIILYSNIMLITKNSGRNDIKDLFVITLRRFLPVLGTFIMYLASIAFFSLFFILPGIFFAFYYFFGVYLSSIGDLNEDNKIMNGGKALGRSFSLVKGNLIRFMILTLVIIIIAFIVENIFILIFKTLDMYSSEIIVIGSMLSSFDIIIIYGSLLFHKFSKIEIDFLEGKGFKEDVEEDLMMAEAAVNSFVKG